MQPGTDESRGSGAMSEEVTDVTDVERLVEEISHCAEQSAPDRLRLSISLAGGEQQRLTVVVRSAASL